MKIFIQYLNSPCNFLSFGIVNPIQITFRNITKMRLKLDLDVFTTWSHKCFIQYLNSPCNFLSFGIVNPIKISFQNFAKLHLKFDLCVTFVLFSSSNFVPLTKYELRITKLSAEIFKFFSTPFFESNFFEAIFLTIDLRTRARIFIHIRSSKNHVYCA